MITEIVNGELYTHDRKGGRYIVQGFRKAQFDGVWYGRRRSVSFIFLKIKIIR
jgi:hypothetical protein